MPTTRRPAFLLLGLLLASLPVFLPDASAQTAAHLTVDMSGQNLTAGFNNTVTIIVRNQYYDALYDVDVALSVASMVPLTLYGDNHWHYDSIKLGQSETITVQVYAPTSAIGSAYQATITLTYKQLGDTSYSSETHGVGFSVQGWINLVLYSILLTPASTTPGGNVTISGSLLNSGNVAAYNANVTVQGDAVDPATSPSLFLGEIDPNIPRPFSLLVVFRKDLPVGNYSLTVRASAVDNEKPGAPYTRDQTATVQIKRSTGIFVRQTQSEGILDQIIRILRAIFTALFGSPFVTVPVAFFREHRGS